MSEYETLTQERERLKSVLQANAHIKHKPTYKAANARLVVVRDRIGKLAKAYKPLQ